MFRHEQEQTLCVVELSTPIVVAAVVENWFLNSTETGFVPVYLRNKDRVKLSIFEVEE